MKKALLKALLPLAIFAVFVGMYVLFERALAPSFQQCIAEKPADKEGTPPKEDQPGFVSVVASYGTCSGRFIEAHGGGITALATIVIAAFTVTLWVATSRQASLTREALIVDKRAFVFASVLNPVWEIDAATQKYNWRLRPTWQNSGDTPTKDLRIFVACEIRNSVLPDGFDFRQMTGGDGTGLLGPKASNLGGVGPQGKFAAISPQDIVDAQQTRKFIYLWGWARYRDAFPKTPEHITRFCWQILTAGDPFLFEPGQPPGQTSSLTFSYVQNRIGNCADDECPY